MTYGWALLILATVMAVLYSVGVFDPQQYMAEECLFQPSLQCKSMVLYKSGQFDLKINNGLGYELKEVSTTAYPLADPTQGISYSQTRVAPNGEITLSQSFGQYAGRLRTGSLERIGVEIKYKVKDDPSGKEYTTTGVVAVRVQP